MNNEIDNVSGNKIYEGIFNIFEVEFEEISHFIALTRGNMNVYSNKIHELHLRVCSEIENILKVVIHKSFVPENIVKERWDTEKSAKLNEKSLFSQYEELKNKLTKSDEKKDLDKYLFGHPDFAFYFKLACKYLKLDKKVTRFLGMASDDIDWEIIQPFELYKGQNVPKWWTHYNKLKHDKIINFDLCTLEDLIYSLSGLFILMNYLLKYRDNRPVEDYQFLTDKLRPDMVPMDCDFCSFNSKFFKATNTCQHPAYYLILPRILSETQYLRVRLSDYKIPSHYNFTEEFLDRKIRDLSLSSHKTMMVTEPDTKENKSRHYHYSLFYTYFDYVETIDINGKNYRELRRFGRFN